MTQQHDLKPLHHGYYQMEIKGINEGILITLDEQEWQDSKLALVGKIEEKQVFFQGARLLQAVSEYLESDIDVRVIQMQVHSWKQTLIANIPLRCPRRRR